MKIWIRKYWVEAIVFSIILAMFLICQAPSPTWIDTNSDGIHLTFAAKYLYTAHKTSAPLYLLLGHLFLYLPFGTDFWRMGLISVLGSFVSAVFVYLIVREHLKGNGLQRFYVILGTVIFAGSALVISQTVIVKYYSLTTMFGLIAYFFVLKQRWSLTALSLGAGIATHGISLFVAIPIFIFNKQIRTWKSLAILAGMALFYLYSPLVGKFNPTPMNMWGNLTPLDQLRDVYSTMMMLSGGLYIGDLPKRVLDTIGIVGVSLGLAVIPLIVYFVKVKKFWRNQLFWLFIIPIIYYATNLAPQTYVYMYPSIAFGAIVAVIGLSKMKVQWAYTVGVVAIGLLIFNANFFDVGRNLDPHLSATEYYNLELAKVPDGQILMPQYGWEWAAIFSYNKNEHRNIVPVAIDTLVSPSYQDTMRRNGIKFEDNRSDDRLVRQNYIALSIVRLNDNVWTTKTTVPETYGCEVVMAKGNEALLEKIPTEPPTQWHWKPSVPYSIITGNIEISQWKFITLSNHNVLFVFEWCLFGYFPFWLINRWYERRKKRAEANGVKR